MCSSSSRRSSSSVVSSVRSRADSSSSSSHVRGASLQLQSLIFCDAGRRLQRRQLGRRQHRVAPAARLVAVNQEAAGEAVRRILDRNANKEKVTAESTAILLIVDRL